MRKPMSRAPAGRRQSGIPRSVPAPVKGWNARDPVAQMDGLYAVVLDNLIPRASYVELRKGAEDHVTGFTNPVKSLCQYAGPSSTELFAATSAGIYDVTTAGVVGAAVAVLTEGTVISCNFSNVGGSYMYVVNGVDEPKLYDGTTWTSINGVSVPALTGITTTSLSYVYPFKSRLWFIEKDSLNVWYLAVNAIGGALTSFPLGGLFKRGGSLVAMHSWTVDGGDGVDDLLVFATSEGELAVYQGTDPSSATTWGLVGIYYIGKPMGPKCFSKYGGDLLYLSARGLAPMSRLLQSATLNRSIQLTDVIDNAFLAAVEAGATVEGWAAVQFPNAGLLVANIPFTDGTAYSYQFVMDTITGGWCRFRGWDAGCFEVFDGELFYGGATSVVRAWTGTSDFGANIEGIAAQAFTYFTPRSGQKQITLVRPILQSTLELGVTLGLAVDFDIPGNLPVTPSPTPSGAVWDTSLWDGALWGGDYFTTRQWRTIASRPGFCFSLLMKVTTNLTDFRWSSIDYIYTVGGVL